MARKRIFSDRRGGEVFLGGNRRTYSFEEAERPVRPRKAPLRSSRQDSLPPHTFERPASRGFHITGIHVAVGFVCVGVVAFLIYFLFFALPSPISGLSPAKNSYVRSPNVDVKATFSRLVKPSQLVIKIDSSDVTMKAAFTAKSVSAQVPLPDGRHTAVVELDGGGLMGKRTAKWSFVVDTSPPKLNITRKTVTDLEGTDQVKVGFQGKTDGDAKIRVGNEDVSVDAKGSFKGEASASRFSSLKIAATDEAGNEAATYVVTQKPVVAKGAHVSIYIASSDSDMVKMIGLVDRTELNALEIDLKDESGQIGFMLDYDLAKKVGSVNDFILLEGIVDQMRYSKVYAICRIVVFKDPKLAKARPDLAVQDTRGGIWGKGQWLDPYSKEVWDYNLAVAIAAAKAGFHEVQFDYVRFPSDGDTDFCRYPNQDKRAPGEVIDGFLAYAREKLAPYNAFISADLFGLTASKQGEMGIGQKVEDVAKRVDFISPMVYPSHYNPGEYNIKSPERNPGDIVSKSLDDFKKVMSGGLAELRPWLQDFSLRVAYTPDMVRRQIDACEKAGVKQWLLWDPDCSYSEQALEKESKK